MTEAAEFMDIYKLDVLDIPTNVPVARIDYDDEVYRTADEKNDAIVKLVEECRERGQPVLVGTTSIEKSEQLSELMKKRKIQHNVLNARYHEQEAFIVAQAGVPGAVTIATNMAGRGTDIQLGGNADMRISHELGGVTDAAEREARDRSASAPKSPPTRRRRWPPAASTSSAPSATKAGASTTSCAAAPAARAIPAPRNSSCPCRTI